MHLHTPVLAGCSFCLSVLQESPRWSGWVVQHIVHPLIVLVIPLTCFLAVVSFIGHSWRRSSGDGVRSLAGSLLPFVIVMCVFIFQPSIFTEVVIANTLVSFVVALLLGLCLPYLAKWKDGSGRTCRRIQFRNDFFNPCLQLCRHQRRSRIHGVLRICDWPAFPHYIYRRAYLQAQDARE